MSATATSRLYRQPIRPRAASQAQDGELKLGLALGGLMLFTIAGTLVAGRIVAFATIPIYIFAVLALSMRDPMAALSFYFAYSAMEGMFKYLSDFSKAVYVVKPALLGLILVGWLITSRRQRRSINKPPLTRWIVLLVLWGLVQVLHPLCRGISNGVITLLLWYVLPASVLALAFNVADRTRKYEQLVHSLVIIATVVSLFAAVQFKMGREWTEARLPGYAAMTSTDWWTTDAQGVVTYAAFRPASTTSMGGGGGYWGHIGAMLAVGVMATPGITFRRRLLMAACLLVNVVGVMASGVRLYVVLAIAEAALWVLFAARSPRELIRNVVLTFLAMAVISGSVMVAQMISGGKLLDRYTETLSDPVARYQKDRGGNLAYLPKLLALFPLGIGYQRSIGGGTNLQEQQQGEIMANRETQFNSIADDMGLPGLILLTGIMIIVPVTGLRALRTLRTTRFRPMGSMLLALLCGFVLMGFAGPSLQGADLYWLFAGLLFAMPAVERREHA